MADTAIRTEGLGKRFGGVEALAGLELEVGRGEVLGYLGPNGAGKTTTIRLLLDLARPTAGRAEVFGLDTQRQAVAVHRRVAYVPGEPALWPSLTGAETLAPPRPHPRLVRLRLSRRAHRAIRPRSGQEGPGLLERQPAEAEPGRRRSCRGPTCSSSMSPRAGSTR